MYRRGSARMKRKPMLFKRLFNNAGHRDKITIGLIGINRGVGVTYTGLLLATYFGLEKRIKTAYLECNNHMDFERLSKAYEWTSETDNSFSLDRVTYYKGVENKRIPDIMGEDYGCYILDFGTDYGDSLNEFIRCGSKIIIGDCAVWNQSRMISFKKSMNNIKGSDKWIYMIPNARCGLSKRMSSEIMRSCYSIPFEPDPTLLSKDAHELFQSLFG